MSITEYHISNPSVEEQIQLFAEVGFDSIFLSYGVTESFEEVPEWAALARRCNIDFEAVHAPTNGVNSMWLGKDGATDYLKRAKDIIDICSDNGIGKMVLHTDWRVTPEPSAAGLESFSLLEEYAQSHAVHLCYENSHNLPQPLAALNSCTDYHGFCLDVGHNLCYTPEVQLAGVVGNKMLFTHLHDNFGERDLHLLPFDGKANWAEIAQCLKKARYTGTLNLEVAGNGKPEYDSMTYREFVLEAFNRLCKIRSMITE